MFSIWYFGIAFGSIQGGGGGGQTQPMIECEPIPFNMMSRYFELRISNNYSVLYAFYCIGACTVKR